ncbi:MAG: anti-sigma factor family protein [Gammaproteobacteria bacterium]
MNREDAQKLLPWFAVGALDSEEARAVEAHLEDSPELRRELAELQVLEREVGEVREHEPQFRPAMIDDALRRIDQYEASRTAPATPGIVERAVEWLRETLVGGWVGSPGGARLAIAAQFALILMLGGVLLAPQTPDRSDATFATSAGGNGADAIAGTTLKVTFQPDATEQRLRETLAAVGGEIVAGPSTQGGYQVRIESVDAAEVARAVEQLRERTEVVRFAAEME